MKKENYIVSGQSTFSFPFWILGGTIHVLLNTNSYSITMIIQKWFFKIVEKYTWIFWHVYKLYSCIHWIHKIIFFLLHFESLYNSNFTLNRSYVNQSMIFIILRCIKAKLDIVIGDTIGWGNFWVAYFRCSKITVLAINTRWLMLLMKAHSF